MIERLLVPHRIAVPDLRPSESGVPCGTDTRYFLRPHLSNNAQVDWVLQAGNRSLPELTQVFGISYEA